MRFCLDVKRVKGNLIYKVGSWFLGDMKICRSETTFAPKKSFVFCKKKLTVEFCGVCIINDL